MSEKRTHVVKNLTPNRGVNFIVRLFSVLISFLFITTLFSLIGNFSFGQTIGYAIDATFGNKANNDHMILNFMQLLILALGLVPAFKMKYWNTGALGQALIGNLCSSIVVFYLGPVIPNNALLLILAFIAAILGGAIWGGIPGIFKAKFKTNETLFTLMLNYIAFELVNAFVEIMKQGQPNLPTFENGKFPELFGNPYGLTIVITLAVAILMYIYLTFTKHGYELSVLGDSFNTAKYAGIDTNKVIIRTSILSGAICAICGYMFTGTSSSLATVSDGGFGFTSIIVAWSSHFSILGMIVISFLIAFLKKGSDGIKNHASQKMNDYASYIAVGIFLLLLIACDFFLNYKIVPTSKYAKIKEKKRKAFKKKHPSLCAALDGIRNSLNTAYAFIENSYKNLVNKIRNLFSKKCKEEK